MKLILNEDPNDISLQIKGNHLAAGSHDHVDSLSAADNLLEIGSQPPMENGFGGNFWGLPPMLANQSPTGIQINFNCAYEYAKINK